MTADFWRSSHGNYWLVDRYTLTQSRAEDLRYASAEELGWVAIWSANVMHKLAKRLSLRQQVTATAIVFLRRFYLKNSYAETDIALVVGACMYVAAKAEETPVHVKNVVTEARATFSEIGINSFPSDVTKLAEMEFYLLEDLEFHLVVYHPYRSLSQLCGRDGRDPSKREAMLEIDDLALQTAWFVINDTYRSDLCLLYPPHIIAIAAIYLAFSLHPPPPPPSKPKQTASPPEAAPSIAPTARGAHHRVLETASAASSPLPSPVQHRAGLLPPPPASAKLPPRPQFLPSAASATASPAQPTSVAAASPAGSNSSASASALGSGGGASGQFAKPGGGTDAVTFLATLNVSLPLVLEVVQQIVALYTLWREYDAAPAPSAAAANAGSRTSPAAKSTGRLASGADERVIGALNRMRDERASDVAHPDSGRPAGNGGGVAAPRRGPG